MTQAQNKASQVFDNLWKSLGGSGSNPDVAQFKSQLSNTTDEQMIQASNHWKEIITPLVQDSNPPQTIVDEVKLFSEELVRRYQAATTGARS